jgi:hypothetical protein
VRACALDFAGLICAFHDYYLERSPANFDRAFRRSARLLIWPDSVNRRM